MKNTHRGLIVLSLVLLMAESALAQRSGGSGRWDYMNNCASCHGVAGRGDGPLVRYLVTPPKDLSLLAQRNGGVFPRDRLTGMIDGRKSPDIGPHGSREMPIWGNTFVEYFTQAGGSHQLAEGAVRQRIQDLVAYLELMQK